MNITKAEMETIINFTEADNTASIYTYNVALKNKLSKYAERNPTLCKLVVSTPDGSCTYEIIKNRLSIVLTNPYPLNRRKKLKSHCERINSCK